MDKKVIAKALNDKEQAEEYARIVQEIDKTNPIIKDLTRW